MKKVMSVLTAMYLLLLLLSGCGGKDSGAAENSSEKSSDQAIKIGVSAFPGWYTGTLFKGLAHSRKMM